MSKEPKLSFKQQQLIVRENAIVDATNNLLAKKGFDLMTMDEVAAQLPINLDMARPKKRGGWGPEILPQVFQHIVSTCPDCGSRNKVHGLAIPFRPKCRNCGRYLT